MRSHSGRDKARNSMRDPTLRARQSEQTKASMHVRKSGRKGSGGHR